MVERWIIFYRNHVLKLKEALFLYNDFFAHLGGGSIGPNSAGRAVDTKVGKLLSNRKSWSKVNQTSVTCFGSKWITVITAQLLTVQVSIFITLYCINRSIFSSTNCKILCRCKLACFLPWMSTPSCCRAIHEYCAFVPWSFLELALLSI